ncbi:MAG: hypothetical protein Q9211_000541 [Gyalolechia sp. 1 TL-2023]
MRKYAIRKHLAHSNRLNSRLAFLVPSIPLRITSNSQRNQGAKRRHANTRRFSTATARAPSPEGGTLGRAEKERLARRAMSEIIHPSIGSSRTLWASLLEQYLPHHLRRKGPREAQNTITNTGKPIPVRDLHVWLAEARKMSESKDDLLAYLVVEEDRQDAVLWLVEEVLKQHIEPPQTSRNLSHRLPALSQHRPVVSLDDMTRSAGVLQEAIDVTALAGSSLDSLTERTSRSVTHECLGEIWRSMGSMIVRAADCEATSVEAKSIMTCVHRILAHLHHVGAIPSSIYNYAPGKDPSMLQRPPTIHYWSLRIMTAISDASWTSMNTTTQQAEGMPLGLANPNPYEGGDLSQPEISSLVPEVEPQIWLDFVLWCCVEGGWVTEAAEILYQMWARKGEKRQYSVIDYNTLNEQHAPKLPWTAMIKASIRRSRMRETAGGATFGSYSDRVHFLKPPERTISSEVVAAIIDGLVSTASLDQDLFGNKHSIVEKYISVCKIMLDRNQLGLGTSSWDSVILRIFESLSTDTKLPPTFLEPIISWSPRFLQEALATNSAYQSDSMAPTYVTDPSAMSLGLLHRLLSDFALVGDYRGALRIFRRLQHTVDANRKASLDHFQAMVTSVLQKDGEDALVGNGEQEEAPGLSFQLPSHILAPFLDLVTDAKEFDLGSWLLYSNDVDGCVIPPTLYSDAVLQPSLIRFATAADDGKLLDNVTQRLKAPIPQAVLRALLHHQIRYANWDAVNEILELLRDGDGPAWDPTDVVALARAVLDAEKHPPSDSPQSSTALSPSGLLQALLRGHYNSIRDPSQPRDLSKTRMLNQLARIIASVPSRLRQDLLPFCSREYNQLSASCAVPTAAFNMLLEFVVRDSGVLQGTRLCERWCFLPGATSLHGPYGRSGGEEVVLPNVQTFYTILRPLSQASTDADQGPSDSSIRHSSDVKTSGNQQKFDDTGISQSRRCIGDQERSVIRWGIARCLNLGVRWKDIKQDLPGLAAYGQNNNSTTIAHDTGTKNGANSQATRALDEKKSAHVAGDGKAMGVARLDDIDGGTIGILHS